MPNNVSDEFKEYCKENNITLKKNGRVMVFPPMFMGITKNLDGNAVAKIEKEILKLLKGQTFGDAKEILNDILNSLEHNSIVQTDIL